MVLAPVPFHSPMKMPSSEEKKIELPMTTAKPMYLSSPICGSPIFWHANWQAQTMPARDARTGAADFAILP